MFSPETRRRGLEPAGCSGNLPANAACVFLKLWFKNLINASEIFSKEPCGHDFSLENVRSGLGQCPILAVGRHL